MTVAVAQQKRKLKNAVTPKKEKQILAHPISAQTTRIVRLKLLFMCAKIVDHSNQTKICYSIHDNRVHEFSKLLDYLDKIRKRKKPWHLGISLTSVHKAA